MKYLDLMDVATHAPNADLELAWIIDVIDRGPEEFRILNGLCEDTEYPPVNYYGPSGMTFEEQRMFMMFAYWAVRI